jgi:hypothetical protein
VKFVPKASDFHIKTLKISYPLELRHVQCLSALAPGQKAKILFILCNTSDRIIGGDVRPAFLNIGPGSIREFDVTQTHFEFLDGKHMALALKDEC